MSRTFIATLIAFLLPWQTRWLLVTPNLGHTTWEFGVVSIFVSQAVLAAWLLYELGLARAAAYVWVRTHARACGGVLALIVVQFIISESRLLTAQFFLQMLLLAGFARLFFLHEKIRRAVAGGFLVAAVMQALLGCVQVVASASFASTIMGIPERHAATPGVAVIVAEGVRHLRAYGGQPHPNIFGALMLVALLAYVFAQKNMIKQSVWQLTTLLTGALFFSFSRSAWAGFLLLLGIAWWQRVRINENQIRVLRTSAAVAACMTIIFFPFVMGRATAVGSLEEKSITERVAGLQTWKTIMHKQVWFGTGAGAYTAVMQENEGYARVPIHNAPLLFAAEFGMVGVIFIVTIVFVMRSKKFLLLSAPFVFIMLPAILVDHFLYSLWAGQVIATLTFLFAWSMFASKPTEANDAGNTAILA